MATINRFDAKDFTGTIGLPMEELVTEFAFGAVWSRPGLDRRSRSILNIGSLTSERGIATAVPYGSSKTGLIGMTRALAVEWAPRGIRVNGLLPGRMWARVEHLIFSKRCVVSS